MKIPQHNRQISNTRQREFLPLSSGVILDRDRLPWIPRSLPFCLASGVYVIGST